MKIRRVGAQLLHTDGRTDRRTDMTKLTVAFRNFANAPNIELCLPVRPLLRNPKLEFHTGGRSGKFIVTFYRFTSTHILQ